MHTLVRAAPYSVKVSYTQLYSNTIPVILPALLNMRTMLKKAARHAKSKKSNPKRFLAGRLAPDMFTYTEQIQYACFMALEMAAPLSGKTPPTLPYDEVSFDDLVKSLDTTIAYLQKITVRDFEKTRVKKMTLFYDRKKSFMPAQYVERIGIPNFFFHTVIAYGILRHLGVPLGKDDYLGR